jgi:DivIVA domain-containing protein
MSPVKREEIERRDFPVGRRGYDQDAVDAHLRRVADELEGTRAPLAAGASEQVRAILEAAEASAADIRADAGRRVARAEEAAGGLLGRLDELERELQALLEALRLSSEKVSEGLAHLREQLGAPEEDEVQPPSSSPDGAPDEAGARLIALNMALGGTPREETARYLAEHFELADAEALLDDVYQRAGQ